MKTKLFTRMGKTIVDLRSEGNPPKTYKSFNQAKKASQLLTQKHGLGAVRCG